MKASVFTWIGVCKGSPFFPEKLDKAFSTEELSEITIFLSTNVHALLQRNAVENLKLLALQVWAGSRESQYCNAVYSILHET